MTLTPDKRLVPSANGRGPLPALAYSAGKARMLQKLSRYDPPSKFRRAANDNSLEYGTAEQVDRLGFAMIGLVGLLGAFLLAI
jgi:hypothetical protein